jgi:peptide/nickel transport system substrate-binding protein/oligopeptide transport system substrate-binding protein
MPRTADHRSAPIALIAALALLIAACTGTEPSGSTAAQGGGTLSIGYKSDIQTFDPSQGYDVVSWPAERLLFDTLVTYGDSADIVPSLATALPEISDDGLTYTFTLQEDVSFVDHTGAVVGTMTADDVAFSFNRLLNPNLTPNPSPVGSGFFQIIVGADTVVDGTASEASGIKVIDAKTIEFTITRPDRTFLNLLAMPFGSIVPKDVATDDTAAFAAAPVGTGPYFLESYQQGQQARFARNTHYWGTPPGPDVMEIRVGIEPATAVQQVEAGTLDVMGDNIPPGSLNDTLADPTYKDWIHRSPFVATQFMSIDTSAPDSPLSNVLVRQAIAHAIDKENIRTLYQGVGTIATCILPPAMPGYDPDCDPYPHDVAKATDLMTQAGFADGFSTELFTDTTDPDPIIAQAIQQDLAAIGIEVKITTQAFDALLGTITVPHQTPMVYLGWFQDFPDPSDFYDPILSCATNSEGNFNLAWYCNEEIDALAAAAHAEQDVAARTEQYKEVFNRIMDDVPWVPIVHPEVVTLVNPRVTTFVLHPVWTFDLTRLAVTP